MAEYDAIIQGEWARAFFERETASAKLLHLYVPTVVDADDLMSFLEDNEGYVDDSLIPLDCFWASDGPSEYPEPHLFGSLHRFVVDAPGRPLVIRRICIEATNKMPVQELLLKGENGSRTHFSFLTWNKAYTLFPTNLSRRCMDYPTTQAANGLSSRLPLDSPPRIMSSERQFIEETESMQ
ncbi:hypothetical protein LTR66_008500 [Elasticomyces elasticus]|nr:hypothetical protein LTR28_003120 [Elasticomyces elasticus]KAK4984444.1 hypothetical protein LTR66_008500 [Elasticomyces elasticus]